MNYAPSDKTKLVYALMGKRISEEQFFREFPATRENIHALITEMLERGLAEKNPDLIESAIPLAYRYGISKDFLHSLNALAREPWHFRHEDIVFALGKIKDPSSVEVLSDTAVAAHPYLENDEFFALGSKSIYALENIQTPEAIKILGGLARNENEILRATARKRLEVISKNPESASGKAAQEVLKDIDGTA